jgi:hypothetical protein
MSLHSDILFWFRANQSLLFLLNAACLAEKQANTIFIVFGLTQPGLESTMFYRTRGEHANHYATDAVIFRESLKLPNKSLFRRGTLDFPIVCFLVYGIIINNLVLYIVIH